ncbi:MAG: type II toxin-antitoxin system Phd/YefM family antitoxin [Propionibacteriaceae bacterium]|nr:type II toxin-antitoxin system Phd/YefM family antitoxin [Propionibacteriaceae bacterium]
MVLMTISDARAGLADVVDQVRITGEPVYLTRRNKPVAALVDLVYLDSLRARSVDVEVWTKEEREAERARRLAQMEAMAKEFGSLVKPGVKHLDSASDFYAAREVDPGDLA